MSHLTVSAIETFAIQVLERQGYTFTAAPIWRRTGKPRSGETTPTSC